jgi:hypothetical protein
MAADAAAIRTQDLQIMNLTAQEAMMACLIGAFGAALVLVMTIYQWA